MAEKIEGLEIRIVDDGLSFQCRREDPNKSPGTVQDLVRQIQNLGITVELDQEAIRKLAETEGADWVEVARGKPPKPPVHGWLEFFVDPSLLDKTAVQDEQGRMDYKNLKLVLNVSKGQPLVRKHDPIPGEGGFDVFGKPIPAEPAQSVKLPVGEGVEIVEDGYLAISAIDGGITTKNETISVTHHYQVTGDVSYKTGNIDFNGSVTITGSVLAGFQVKADGDIVINGLVEPSTIEAQGSININGGIQGGGKGSVKAKGTIRAKFAIDATLEAEGDIILQTQCLNCEVTTRKSLNLVGNKSVIAGGTIRAMDGIRSHFVGTEMGVKTVLQIGMDPDLPQKISAAEEELDQATRKQKDVQRLVSQLNTAKERLGNLPPAQEAIRVKAVREQFLLIGRIETLSKSIEEMKDDLQRSRNGIIQVEDTAFAGVVVRFPGDTYAVNHPHRYTTFYYEKGEINTRAR